MSTHQLLGIQKTPGFLKGAAHLGGSFALWWEEHVNNPRGGQVGPDALEEARPAEDDEKTALVSPNFLRGATSQCPTARCLACARTLAPV